MPKKVFTTGLEIDSIEKCLWILCKKFIFATTTKVKVSYFQSLKHTLAALLEINFPMLILVEGKLATYHHVVVVWQQRVIDYESMFSYPLTEGSLKQICAVNTNFTRISGGYGIFTSKTISKNQRMGM